MIRLVLPSPLRSLARIDGELELKVEPPITVAATLDALEARYPVLRGTLRDPATGSRRPFIRFFGAQRDLTHEPVGAVLPLEVVNGREPLLIVGAMAGG